MTARRAAALTAAGVAALGLAARPLLPHPHPPTTAPAAAPAATAPGGPPGVTAAAARAARRALGCPHHAGHHPSPTAAGRWRWCGPLQVHRDQARCPTTTTCQVQLLATLRTAAAGRVPVALAVTVTRSAAGWRAETVRS
jgi:hypothetical protein